ncbi:hypothetical protein [Paraburkholderia fungorum]|jgi:hypothetical protein|uniref:hypothetical protein n=1 Tax=Paraburkholderia fungorum TaxID=134537 RepID=UPI000D053CF6|nr:hypothetical protein [Paraburkholderia fungorum]PRZ42893.1 hypothetical protein BX589_1549 [Paraburkholderia fungorum]
MSKREVMDRALDDIALAMKKNRESGATIKQDIIWQFDKMMESEAWMTLTKDIPLPVLEHYSDKKIQQEFADSLSPKPAKVVKEPTTLEEVEATIPEKLAMYIKEGACNPADPKDVSAWKRTILVAGCKKAGIVVPDDPPLENNGGSIADRLGLPEDDEDDVPHEPSDLDVYTMFDEE